MDMPTEMQHQAMGYDRAATMFSPEGHLLQVEYAEKTVRLGSASIGLTCKDGVVIVADKRVRDKLIAPESASKIFEVDEHMMAISSGILSDARILMDHAQVLAQQNRVTYGTPIEPVLVIRMIADKKQIFTQYGGARPFAVAVMLAGVNKRKTHLYTTDVAGNYSAYKANAIGENDEKIKEVLRSEYKEDVTIDEGIKFCFKIFKSVLGKNFDSNRFEVGFIKHGEEKLHRIDGEELKKYVK
ncbi:proteasome subunit alpha [Candidatus Pacearchaeota archaeon]|jgi:proteasome alpha subunit|nr:proteasome subunit alpha [Candidatus Pacearchaeota archaeon]|tara:strand:+ start:1604 stop:2329 length:726 start_codon:yes stop_codon:yes gene_type:complete